MEQVLAASVAGIEVTYIEPELIDMDAAGLSITPERLMAVTPAALRWVREESEFGALDALGFPTHDACVDALNEDYRQLGRLA